MPTFNDNLFNFLRMNNVFGGIGIPNSAPVGNDLPSQGGIMGNLPVEQGFTPQTMAQDQYRASLEAMPVREKPGTGRRILAILAGLGGPRAADEVLFGKYNQEMEDWKTKNAGLKDLAGLEMQGNTQERLFQNTVLNENYRRDREKRIAEDADERIRLANEKADLDKKKFELQQELANGGRAISDKDGNMFVLTRKGEIKDIDKKSLSLADRMQLANEGRLTIVNDQQEAARELARYRAELESDLIRQRTDEGIRRDKEKATTDDSEKSDTQKKVEIGNRARAFILKYPQFNRFVTVDGDVPSISDAADSPLLSRNKFTTQDREAIRAHIMEGKELPANFGVVQTPTQTRPTFNKSAPTRVGPTASQVLPPKEQRENGMKWTLPNGKKVKWNKAQMAWEDQ